MAKKKIEQVAAGELAFDMTPMIDVVFQLIIFFLVALSFVETQARAKLVLPVADQAKPPEKADHDVFIVNVINVNERDKNGEEIFTDKRPYFVNGEQTSTAGLANLLAIAARVSRGADPKADVKTAVIIRADRDTEWKVVLSTMNECRKAEFQKIYLKALEKQPDE